MFKLKDGVPLEKLKEFGFKQECPSTYSRHINNLWYARICIDCERIYRVITNTNDCQIKFDNLEGYISDLVDADLVEEISNDDVGIEQLIIKLMEGSNSHEL